MSQWRHGNADEPGMPSDGQDRQSAALGLFAEALKKFQAIIPQDERAAFDQFGSCGSMLEVIEAQAAKSPEKSRLLRCCKKINHFATRWEPFFEITNIVVSSHPEWAALAWGAVRLVFKLCDHYTVFFEKLADMFDRIASKLPHFGRHIDLFNRRKRQRPDLERNAALTQTLGYIFKDIMQFCQEACHIFCAKDKGVRYKLNVVKDIFWKPFDARFSDLLARLDRYEKMYELELNLADREELMGHYENFEAFVAECNREREIREGQSRREEALALRRQVRDIKAWIQAPEYMAAPERERVACSGSWLLENDAYVTWRQSWVEPQTDCSEPEQSSRALFIYGSPGYGKTVLSVKAIEDLESESGGTCRGDETKTVAFFHFNKMNSRHREPAQALRAILSQIIHKHQDDKELIDAATVLMDVEGSGQAVASEGEVAVILKLFLERYPSTALVFDGIDECSVPRNFLDKLYAICWSSHCRLLLFSRPNVAVPLTWQHRCRHIRLQLGANTHDIAAYVRPRMEQLVTSELIPALDIELSVSQIAQRANSLFLWARVLMDYLECPALTPGERLRAISHLNLLEGLNPLYTEILDTIQTKFREERDAAYRAFRWIAVAHRPLKVSELRTALAVQIGKKSSELNYIANFQQSLIQICGALVEIHQDDTVHFIHLSAKEFLTDAWRVFEPRGPKVYHIDIATTHISVASLCLSYIIHDVPQGPLSGSSTINAHLPHVEASLPLLRYALDWPTHAVEGLKWKTYLCMSEFSRACLTFAQVTEEFLQMKRALGVWLESVWAFGATPHVRDLAVHLSNAHVGKSEANGPHGHAEDHHTFDVFLGLRRGIDLLAADYEYLQKEWAHLLVEEPCELWGPSINIFHTSELMMGTKAGALVPPPRVPGTGVGQAHFASDPTCPASHDKVVETLLLTQSSQNGEQIGSVFLIPPECYLREEHTLLGMQAGGVDAHPDPGAAASCPWDDESVHDTDSDSGSDISPLEACEKASIAARLSVGWRARIQIRPTSSSLGQSQNAQLIDVVVDMPWDQIFQMLMLTFYHEETGHFRAPAAFSRDLRTIVVLRCVVRLASDGYALQKIDSSGIRNTNEEILQRPRSIYAEQLDMSNQVWYAVSFSQDGRYFAAIRSGPISHVDTTDSIPGEYYHCSVAVFKDIGCGNGDAELLYEEIASTGLMDEVGGVTKPVAFHPSAPYLAIGNSEAVYLWKFDVKDEAPRELFSGRIDNLTFSPTGTMLSGDKGSLPVLYEVDYEMLRWDRSPPGELSDNASESCQGDWTESGDYDFMANFVDFDAEGLEQIPAEDTKHVPSPAPESHSSIACTTAGRSNIQGVLDLVGVVEAGRDALAPAIQSSNDSLVFSSASGMHRSLLMTERSVGAIVLQATAADGTVKTADLLRVPKSVLEDGFHTTIINPTADSSSVRLVLNKAPEPTYVFGRSANIQFPIVIDRHKDSIPVVSTKRMVGWEEQSRVGRKRLKNE
ncbi:NACHT domain-containing protein [Madurella fahalii]|uniref:NACHT domain-containing protein n=1 Tax=Madurella fahalii TaxID=1157608 RepID=A0ABQ0GJB7_9PEZI